MQRKINLVGLSKRERRDRGWGWGDMERGREEKNCTAIVSIDLDRTDNRFHGFDVLKGFHWFIYRAVRWATSNL